MSDYRREKRPPNYGDDDYVLRALYRLLGKHFSPRRNKSFSSNSYRPVNRGFGRAAGSKGPSGPRGSYAQQYRPSYGHGQNNGFVVPKKPEPSYPRESRPYVQSLPQPRTEPDTEELLRQLEQKMDGRLVEQVMARLDAVSNAVEAEVNANPTEPKAETEKATDSRDAVLADTVPDAKDAVAEEAKPEPSEPEPEPLDNFELDELEWLDEEVRGLVVEAEDGEPAFVSLEALEHADSEPAPEVSPVEAIELVKPELETPLIEPLVEADPLNSLEPGIDGDAETEEEAEPL